MLVKNRVIEEEEINHKIKNNELIYVDTIKFTLKQYKLPFIGKKKELINTLLLYHKNNYYNKNIEQIIFVQRRFRDRYSKIDFVNTEDFYTLDPLNKIEKHFLFSYIDQHKFRYGFDIRSLNILIEKSNINPYNRTPIPDNIILTIRNKIEELKKFVKI